MFFTCTKYLVVGWCNWKIGNIVLQWKILLYYRYAKKMPHWENSLLKSTWYSSISSTHFLLAPFLFQWSGQLWEIFSLWGSEFKCIDGMVIILIRPFSQENCTSQFWRLSSFNEITRSCCCCPSLLVLFVKSL